MPWGWFSIALLVTYVLQTAAVPYVGVTALDLLLVLALLCGLVAPAQEARLAAWITGFVQDIGTAPGSPLGLHALAFGLAVLGLTYLREWVNRHVWWVRWLIAFLVAWPTQFLVHLHTRFLQGADLPWSRMVLEALVTALLAALLAALLVALPTALGRRRRHSASWR